MGYESKYRIQSRKHATTNNKTPPLSPTHNLEKGEKRMRKIVFRSSSRKSTVVASFKKWSTVPNFLEWSIQR